MQREFAIATSHGTDVAVDPVTRRLVHGHPGGDGFAHALLVAGEGAIPRCIVLPADGGQGAVPLLGRAAGDGLLTLRNPATSCYLSAVPGGAVEDDRTVPAAWEQFRPAPTETGSAARQFAAALRPTLAAPLTWADTLAAVLAAPPSAATAGLAQAIWPLLTLAEFDRLAARLRHGPALAAQLAALFPEDFWAATAVPALRRWLETRSTAEAQLTPHSHLALPSGFVTAGRPGQIPEPHLIGPERDHLARDGVDGRLVSLGHACNAALRRMVAPWRGTAIVATARSEGIYLLEWIAHHRLLGVEAIFLYSNDNDDGSDGLLAALHAAGIVTWTRSEMAPGTAAQNKAYGHALGVLPPLLDYRWALFIDLDEFLVLAPERYPDIGAFARHHEMRQTDAIGLNWVMVGSGGRLQWDPAPLTHRNTHLLGGANPHIKVMLAPRRFIQAHPHFPFAEARRSFTFRLASGALHEHRRQPRGAYHAAAFADDPSDAEACLYHYHHKSLEEFVWKSARNRGDFPLSHDVTFDSLDEGGAQLFLGQHHAADATFDDRIRRCVPDLDAEIDRLRALPGVRAAEQATIARFRARLAAVTADLLAGPRLAALGGAGAALRRLLLDAQG